MKWKWSFVAQGVYKGGLIALSYEIDLPCLSNCKHFFECQVQFVLDLLLHLFFFLADIPFCSVRQQAFNIGFDALLPFRYRFGYIENLCVRELDYSSVVFRELAGATLDSGKALCAVIFVPSLRHKLRGKFCDQFKCPEVSVLYQFKPLTFSTMMSCASLTALSRSSPRGGH
jgi:hypothetical protein